VSLLWLIVSLYVRAMLFAFGVALLVTMLTGALVLSGARRLADLTGHRTTILVPAVGDGRFYWAALSTGLGIWSLIAWLVA
jgi:hypothetical protein